LQVTTGLTTLWISNVGITPECVQRFVAIPKLSDAIKACWIFGVGHIVIKLFAIYNGLLIFAKYTIEKCDPVYNGDVEKYDQIFPYYVMDVARNIPGLPGLFIVGALSAALSSMSSCLNALSGTIYEDFIRPYLPNASEARASSIMKIVTFCVGEYHERCFHRGLTETDDISSVKYGFSMFSFLISGCVCFGLVFVVERLGGVFSIGIALSGISSGPLLGLFTMGMVRFLIFMVLIDVARISREAHLLFRFQRDSIRRVRCGVRSYQSHPLVLSLLELKSTLSTEIFSTKLFLSTSNSVTYRHESMEPRELPDCSAEKLFSLKQLISQDSKQHAALLCSICWSG
jgi:Na+/proline symporter